MRHIRGQGLGGPREDRALAALGIRVLRFDFTGLGQSGGDFSQATFSGDVADLAATARSSLKARPVARRGSFVIRQSFVEDLRDRDQRHRIAHLGHQLLVLHSPQDEAVSIGNVMVIFQAARHLMSFVSLDPADHLLTKAGCRGDDHALDDALRSSN